MNRIEISKELFDNVFEGCVFNYVKDDVIHYSQPCVIMEGSWVESETSINDFFFDCKEWAMNKGFQIISGLSDEPAYRPQDERAYSKVLWYEGDDIHREYKDIYFTANTEVEAVIKASEYILKEISSKYLL